MRLPARFDGVLCPVVTPFGDDLVPDAAALTRQCEWLLSAGVGLAVFGTNSEANSMTVAEKSRLLEQLVGNGIPPDRLMPGTGCCAAGDTVELTRRAVTLGCRGVLMLPPFYYKGVSDDGLYASFANIIERVDDERLRIYLYHIPPVSGVGLSVPLIERLVRDYPQQVAGIKDSSGDWEGTAAMHSRQWDDFRIFVGTESLLLANMRAGGAGCISATANINPHRIAALYRDWRSDNADAAQRDLDDVRGIVQAMPMIPALKAIVSHFSGDRQWRNVRPPLVALDGERSGRLLAALQARQFDMPGLGQGPA